MSITTPVIDTARLRERPEVDAGHTGVWGHIQGDWIAHDESGVYFAIELEP